LLPVIKSDIIQIFLPLGDNQMNGIKIFIKKNKWITVFFVISLGIIISYILTMDLPELFDGAGEWYNLLFQLSVGYIINFMFYITQVYLPNSKRETKVRECLSKRIDQLIRDMDASLSHLSKIYANGHSEKVYTDEELQLILNHLNLSDHVQVINAAKSKSDNFSYFTVREWLLKCIEDTETDIDNIYKCYGSDISGDLMDALEKILKSTYHSVMKVLLLAPEEVDFSSSNANFFKSYYKMMKNLEQIKAKDYT